MSEISEKHARTCVRMIGDIAELDMEVSWGKISKEEAWNKLQDILKGGVC